ncbi:N-acetylmuramoyl-L-alanine amidase [Oceanobacillus saliphilus]|uniref:N-acetylmuramoyl-L-alanine amidase n=1 Tax=Oceanobacillus saliphilus TaxID=2925834 RepID=UPI00201E700D|nr:N-acetylmuramoyl-L-alanine amidase [Oceanobacillus saliphilus]
MKKAYLVMLLLLITLLMACGTKGIAISQDEAMSIGSEADENSRITEIKLKVVPIVGNVLTEDNETLGGNERDAAKEQEQPVAVEKNQSAKQEMEEQIHNEAEKVSHASEKETSIKSESVDSKVVENEIDKENKEEDTYPQQKVLTGIASTDALLPEENSRERTTPITHVMMHFTSNVIGNPQSPYELEDTRTIFIDYGVSAHYLIGRNGEIYNLVPEDRVAFHAGKGDLPDYPHYQDQLNDYSIGIEVMAIGTKEEMQTMMSDSFYDSIDPAHIGYTDAQYASLKRLLDDILLRNPSIKKDRNHVVGHDEYAPGRKTDPGSLFDWSRIGF